MAEKIDRGFTQVGNKIYFSDELEAYLKPTLSGPDDRRGSLVGDGLASCVLGFDHTDKKRSRTILLATDNEVFGEGIYNLAESIEFAKSQGVTVSVLYPGSSYALKDEGVELQDQVKSTGGDFYDASSPSAVDDVVRQIESEQKEELDSAGKLVETDRPGAALGWTIVGVLSLLGLLAFGRL
jgi:putative von willebrand factor type A domain protein